MEPAMTQVHETWEAHPTVAVDGQWDEPLHVPYLSAPPLSKGPSPPPPSSLYS